MGDKRGAQPNPKSPTPEALEAARGIWGGDFTVNGFALALDAFAAAERERVATAVANEYGEPRLAARIRAMGGERG